jgi:hypothetical protein
MDLNNVMDTLQENMCLNDIVQNDIVSFRHARKGHLMSFFILMYSMQAGLDDTMPF